MNVRRLFCMKQTPGQIGAGQMAKKMGRKISLGPV